MLDHAHAPPPPGHPIILLKPNQFNIAAVSVKRSVEIVFTLFGRNSFIIYFLCVFEFVALVYF